MCIRDRDGASLQIMGHRAIPEIDAMVLEQAMLAWGLQVIGESQDLRSEGRILIIRPVRAERTPASR